jgi:hypothetical protein
MICVERCHRTFGQTDAGQVCHQREALCLVGRSWPCFSENSVSVVVACCFSENLASLVFLYSRSWRFDGWTRPAGCVRSGDGQRYIYVAVLDQETVRYVICWLGRLIYLWVGPLGWHLGRLIFIVWRVVGFHRSFAGLRFCWFFQLWDRAYRTSSGLFWRTKGLFTYGHHRSAFNR